MTTIETRLFTVCPPEEYADNIAEAGRLLVAGELVAIPTETVYGLGANALDQIAVENIFRAKGRPQDNPLIVHICDMDMIYMAVSSLPERAKILAAAFWPGPLTMILPKSEGLAPATTAGLDSVGVRMPAHPAALAMIKAAGCPIAAPSANISGRPSPTTAQHCIEDLWGKVAAIADGGECSVGIESTVLSLLEETPMVLRPGAITPRQISKALGGVSVRVAQAVLSEVGEGTKILSPGMKYRHYSPKAKVIIVRGELQSFVRFVNDLTEEGIYTLLFEGEEKDLTKPWVSYGIKGDSISQAQQLFGALRRFDSLGAKTVYARSPELNEDELGVYNRLLRAAAFEVIDV